MQLINKQEDFDKVCHKLLQQPIIYVDTEFHRRITYFAKLSIIQIATNSDEIVVDALCGIDLSLLKQVFDNENIVKVFHSPDQDFEIFYNLFGQLPKNVFDTQIAAFVCGIDSEMMGYSRLCKSLLNIEVDKSLQKSNWMKRPLSAELLEYATRDTEFLIPLYTILSKMIDEQKKWPKYQELLIPLLNPKTYKFSSDKIIKKMRMHNNSELIKNRLKVLVDFREECAIVKNMPRSFFATNLELIQISKQLPTTTKELVALRLNKRMIAREQFRTKLFEICEGLKNQL